jgi:hypothetical protein
MRTICALTFLTICNWTCVLADSLVINAWTNPVSGYWEDLKWSLGVQPGPGQTIMITNQGWKAVGIGTNTTQKFPGTLDVSSVILGGYTDSFNTLLLNYAGLEVPLTTGSMNVGSNSAVTVLASVVSVLATNSAPGDISIFSAFNQGEQAIVNAHAIRMGDLFNPGAGPGTYNETNGTIHTAVISAWAGSTFNQFGGSNQIDGELNLGGADNANVAHYRIASGSLTASSIELERGDFNQTDGSVAAGLYLGAATYRLSGGTLQVPGITIPNVHYGLQNPGGFLAADATLLQTGGTNFCNGTLTAYHEYGAPGVGVPFIGPGRYVLSNGVLCVSSTVHSWMGDFLQWGGWHTNAGTEVTGGIYPNWEIRTGSFTLGGGTLVTPSISVALGTFTQSGGTNQVSGNVNIGIPMPGREGGSPATFTLAGGLLTDLNTSIDATHPAVPAPQYALFSQSGGSHIVTNLLHISGIGGSYGSYYYYYGQPGYVLSGGGLNAPNIQIDSGGVFDHQGGALTSSGLLNLAAATWYEKTSGQQFGQLLLSAPAGSNATFSLPSGNCVLHFANSSSVAWANQATLFIDNWKGSPSGGGQHQFIFGSSSSALTPQQVSQIQFRNPAGASGTFPARILSTGEIVPDRFLAAHKGSNSLVIEWSSGTLQSATNVTGPYENVSGATSPYTAPLTAPQQFFRIRN